MSAARDLLDRIEASGVAVALEPDGRIRLHPIGVLPADLLAAAKAQRDELAALLATNPRPRTDRESEAHLSRLSPAAHTAFTSAANGSAEARIREPDGRWSAPLAVRPPRFDTPPHVSLPWCSGWCTGCGAPSKWRADPQPAQSPTVLRWCCMQCDGAYTDARQARI